MTPLYQPENGNSWAPASLAFLSCCPIACPIMAAIGQRLGAPDGVFSTAAARSKAASFRLSLANVESLTGKARVPPAKNRDRDRDLSLLRERAEQNITDATMRASSLMSELLDPDKSAHVAAKVGLRLLESEGFIRPAGHPGGVRVQINNRAGFIVDWHNSRDPGPYSPEELAIIERQGIDPSEYLKSRGRLIDVTQEPASCDSQQRVLIS